MSKLVIASVAAGVFAAMVGQAQAQVQVPRHFHSLTTPNNETHTIARGLTTNATCQAFLNFHGTVHTEVFGTPTSEGKHPLGPLGATVVTPMEFCP